MRRTGLLLASLALAVLLACGVTLVAGKKPAQAAFPGENGMIAFQSPADGDYEIYAINPSGGRARNLTRDPADDRSPAWSPDGTKIAFVREISSTATRIFVMNADGTEQVGLQAATGNGDLSPTWSPDGERIAYSGVCIIDADGTDRICPAAMDGGSMPTWSSKDKIAFAKRLTFNSPVTNIFTSDPDGSATPANISEPDAYDMAPDWSPDGTKIIFRTKADSTFWRIHTMDADGSDRQPVGSGLGLVGDFPVWSPDGKKVAFQEGGRTYVADLSAPTDTLTELTVGTQPDWQPNTAPVISRLRSAPGSTITDRTPRIQAKVTDLQTNLLERNITLALDDQTISRRAFSYDAATDRLQYEPPSALSYGRHTVAITAVDSVGLRATERWSFRIVRP